MKNILRTLRHPSISHHPHAPILALENVFVRYETGLVLENISFDLLTGESVAVVGPNGAGKSTLFKVIAGVLHPDAGAVKVAGHAPSGHICISYLPQRSQVDWDFPVTVADVVMMGRIGKLGLLNWAKAKDWNQVQEALKIVGLTDLSKRQISELSGGQQQRMFIARALAQEAELMLMDEPLTGLDIPSQKNILAIINTLRGENVTLMVAMHDLKLAAEQFDRVMLLNASILGFGTPEQVFTRNLLSRAYGGHFHIIEGDTNSLAVSDTCCEGGNYGLD
ncbi:MAG: metal ABC transporter ATP-binding protein [Chloroflexota bacterium]|nr:metal ABC transporter ATP-binding protein [Chloroflexota bacterium]